MANKKEITECPMCGCKDLYMDSGTMALNSQTDEEARYDNVVCPECGWRDCWWDYFDTY